MESGDRHERPTGRVVVLSYYAGQGSLSSLPPSHITIRVSCQALSGLGYPCELTLADEVSSVRHRCTQWGRGSRIGFKLSLTDG